MPPASSGISGESWQWSLAALDDTTKGMSKLEDAEKVVAELSPAEKASLLQLARAEQLFQDLLCLRHPDMLSGPPRKSTTLFVPLCVFASSAFNLSVAQKSLSKLCHDYC
jgi:hypothetical protein